MAGIFKKVGKRAWVKVMDRVGGRLVSGMADTSADAPSARFEPKRNLYEKMQKEAAEQTEQSHSHSHGHSHDHGDEE